MLNKKLALAALGLAASAPVFANPPHWAPAYGWRAHEPHPYVRYHPVARPVIRPYVLAPYSAPPPVVYRPVRVAPPAPGFSIRIDLPL
jgi:hypothetical protein